jgi:hypothetical protein
MSKKRSRQALLVPSILLLSSLAIVDNSYRLDPLACGPDSINSALQELSPEREYSLEGIRKRISGREPIRNLLSIFNRRALAITWPWEMERIIEEHGYNVRGEGNCILEAGPNEKRRLVEITEREMKEGNQVIAQVFNSERLERHWEFVSSPEDFYKKKVYNLLIISK